MGKPQILKVTSWEKYRLSRQSVTKHRKDGLLWIPVYVESWLTGSIHFELEPDEQATFLDLLLLAAKDDGYIRANEVTPYPFRFLAGYLNKTEELIERTIKKCLRPEIDKLRVVPLQDCKPPLQTEQPPLQKCSPRVEKSRVEKSREDTPEAKDASGSSAQEKASPSRKPPKRKAYHLWTDEEIAEATPVNQCQAIFDRLYFQLTGYPPDRNYAEDGAKFKRWLAKGWEVQKWLPIFFKKAGEKDAELGGYTVGVFKAFVTRAQASDAQGKREEK